MASNNGDLCIIVTETMENDVMIIYSSFFTVLLLEIEHTWPDWLRDILRPISAHFMVLGMRDVHVMNMTYDEYHKHFNGIERIVNTRFGKQQMAFLNSVT